MFVAGGSHPTKLKIRQPNTHDAFKIIKDFFYHKIAYDIVVNVHGYHDPLID
jgi:hypothetical protein